ncbi:retrovirus-related Pol polyprotein from transposon 17.6 [Elysia marginata]|uniref:Retrovirus-related Pol polyprotein from transposon 17.6 n=1 Tax=Elysia marginata TaxID=1093978 RepID=A0AAV4I8F5_9GAST|nr:retrovirus-related Pol polyprotein from transposon 17.6 [Elysia marginata]
MCTQVRISVKTAYIFCIRILHHDDIIEEIPLDFHESLRKEFPADLTIKASLKFRQRLNALAVFHRYSDTLTDIPELTENFQHIIHVTDDTPFTMCQYPTPIHATVEVDKEIDRMLQTGNVQPSSSPYC